MANFSALNKWDGAQALLVGLCSQHVPRDVTAEAGWKYDSTCLEAHETVVIRERNRVRRRERAGSLGLEFLCSQ